MSLTPRRVLFVSYCFPPMGGVSVQRVTKFVKYLPEYGWNCSVLTVKDPSEALMDDSLLKEIPEATIIRRARTYEPGQAVKAAVSAGDSESRSLATSGLKFIKSIVRKAATTLLQPDAQILWRPHALREGLKLLREVPHDAIIATGPPFSSLLLGATLARRSGLPLILDYRDEWGISNAYWENRQTSWFINALQMRMQKSAIGTARSLVATTPSSASTLGSIAADTGSSARSYCIYNGFDASDFNESHQAGERKELGYGTNKFRLTLIGSLWNLVPVQPFVAGVQRLKSNHPEFAEALEVVIVGNRTQVQEQALNGISDCGVAIYRAPFVPHAKALELAQSSDALLLILGDVPGAERVVNARTFEYMAARKPMLVVAPEGDLWDIVRDLPGTQLCEPGDPDRIADALAAMISQHQQGHRHDPSEWKIDRFDRRSLAGELADILNEVSGGGSPEARPEGQLQAASNDRQVTDILSLTQE